MGQFFCIAPTLDHLTDLVDLDQHILGGLWGPDLYRQEVDSPNSCLRLLGQPRPGSVPSGTLDFFGMGCYWAILDEAHITLLGIRPAYQRRGLGRWLLIHLLEAAWQQGMARATLEVRVSNQGAISLYESLGFTALGTRKRYYGDGEDALILWQNDLKKPEFQEKLRSRRTDIEARLGQQGWQIVLPRNVADHT